MAKKDKQWIWGCSSTGPRCTVEAEGAVNVGCQLLLNVDCQTICYLFSSERYSCMCRGRLNAHSIGLY